MIPSRQSGPQTRRPSPGRLAVALTLALWLLAPAPAWAKQAPPPPFQGVLVRVADGDSFWVQTGQRRVEVRLFGLDCPERDQPWGERAREFTEGFLGREIGVKPVDVDTHGRVVAWVSLPDGRSLNRELLQRGLAWWFVRYAAAEKPLARDWWQALQTRTGLWGDPAPQLPPWEWRRLRPNRR
ncbi:MAG: thermonuclease family protein [Deltaproteobacteria bacterium]|nr:thermonuclease family protein [Deltaproteobacteria bacterium]